MHRRDLLKALGTATLSAAAMASGAGLAGCAGASDGQAADGRPGEQAPAGAPGGQAPSDILPLRTWWLTLPTGSPDATIVKDLEGYQNDPWFVGQPGGIRLRANAGGATTSGSRFPRCELRELDEDREQASWSFTEGTHVMEATVAVTATPVGKPEVCFAQVHGTDSDLLILYYDGKVGGVRWKLDSDIRPLVLPYTPGQPLAVRIEVSGGRCAVQLDGTPVIEFESDRDTCYFRTGAYVLSNPSSGEAPDAIGETVLSALAVEHS